VYTHNGSFRDIVRFVNKELSKEENQQYWKKKKKNILLLEAVAERTTIYPIA
jgi:hypothetical protein